MDREGNACTVAAGGEPRRCTRCILPGTYPDIRFDEEGVCSVCREYDQNWAEWRRRGEGHARAELDAILARIRSLHRRYDALVPLSGGKDSTYVLYLARRKLGLNVLAATFDNGFQSQQAIDNIRNAVRILDVDLVTVKPQWSLMKKLYRTFLLDAGEFCTPCNIGITEMNDRLALQERIPVVFQGNSRRSDENSAKEIYHCSQRYFARVVRTCGIERDLKGSIYEGALKSITLTGRVDRRLSRMANARHLYRLARHPLLLSIPDYFEWREPEIYPILHDELEWQAATKLKEHSDCRMNEAKSHLRTLRWGFGCKTQKLAALVRDGQIERQAALEGIIGECDEPAAFANLLSELDLDRSDVASIRANYHMRFVDR